VAQVYKRPAHWGVCR